MAHGLAGARPGGAGGKGHLSACVRPSGAPLVCCAWRVRKCDGVEWAVRSRPTHSSSSSHCWLTQQIAYSRRKPAAVLRLREPLVMSTICVEELGCLARVGPRAIIWRCLSSALPEQLRQIYDSQGSLMSPHLCSSFLQVSSPALAYSATNEFSCDKTIFCVHRCGQGRASSSQLPRFNNGPFTE